MILALFLLAALPELEGPPQALSPVVACFPSRDGAATCCFIEYADRTFGILTYAPLNCFPTKGGSDVRRNDPRGASRPQ